jgi:hypothetical protein
MKALKPEVWTYMISLHLLRVFFPSPNSLPDQFLILIPHITWNNVQKHASNPVQPSRQMYLTALCDRSALCCDPRRIQTFNVAAQSTQSALSEQAQSVPRFQYLQPFRRESLSPLSPQVALLLSISSLEQDNSLLHTNGETRY